MRRQVRHMERDVNAPPLTQSERARRARGGEGVKPCPFRILQSVKHFKYYSTIHQSKTISPFKKLAERARARCVTLRSFVRNSNTWASAAVGGNCGREEQSQTKSSPTSISFSSAVKIRLELVKDTRCDDLVVLYRCAVRQGRNLPYFLTR